MSGIGEHRVVYVRSPHSKLHLAVMVGDAVLSNERCNLDDMTEDRHLFDEMPEVDARDLCALCFPPSAMQHDAWTVTA